MKAVMLAAGVGKRLEDSISGGLPKVLLRFDGMTLLERHIRNLKTLGIEGLTMCVGYRHEYIEEEILRLGEQAFVTLFHNPDYTDGSIRSLWSAKDAIEHGDSVLLMDGDVLYHDEILGKLVHSAHESCLLLDREFADGPEPVRVCVAENCIVDFQKEAKTESDLVGESVGFFKLSPHIARKLIHITGKYIDEGKLDVPYEDPIRDLLFSVRMQFQYEDITGLPWTEIDYKEDYERARLHVLPKLRDLPISVQPV